MEERQAASDRRLQIIQETLQASRSAATPPSDLSAISILTSPTFIATPRLLRYRSKAIQTSPSGARTTADVVNSSTTIDVSSDSEDERHAGALASTGDLMLDGSDSLDNRSAQGGLAPAGRPRRVVVIIDSDEEVFTHWYPIAGSPDQQSQEIFSPPPPGQRPSPRTPSPSPSWESVTPDAFPATPYGADKVTSPHNGSIYADYWDDYEIEMD